MIKLVVGLGNPGKGYELTRHNVGYMVVDSFVKKRKGRFAEQKADYHLAALRLKSQLIHFAKPMTYMNLSGRAIKTLLAHLELQPSEILVISDDFALGFGKLRLRINGTDGGHNGLRSIIETINSEDFPRLRLGIGTVPAGTAAEDYVLQRFSQEELDSLEDFITLGVNCLETVIYTGLAEAMNKFNGL